MKKIVLFLMVISLVIMNTGTTAICGSNSITAPPAGTGYLRVIYTTDSDIITIRVAPQEGSASLSILIINSWTQQTMHDQINAIQETTKVLTVGKGQRVLAFRWIGGTGKSAQITWD